MFLLKKAFPDSSNAIVLHCLSVLSNYSFSQMSEGQAFFVMAKVLFLLPLFYYLCTEHIALVAF